VRAGSLSIIVPVFNEAARIGGTLTALCAALTALPFDWEIRVVDDGSADESAEIVDAAAQREPRIVLQRELHRGKGAAVRAGMLAANGALRFMCDADLSMPVSELSKFIAVVPDACDVAIAVREGAGARRVNEPPLRHVMGRAFNRIVQGFLLPGLEDTQCGFKMFSGAAARAIFERATLDGWAFDIEALVIAREMGFRIRPVPIECHYDGQSSVRPVRDGLGMMRDLIRVRLGAGRRSGRG
jgi:dolichyl-phosphate beta-glucosyltransferase